MKEEWMKKSDLAWAQYDAASEACYSYMSWCLDIRSNH